MINFDAILEARRDFHEANNRAAREVRLNPADLKRLMGSLNFQPCSELTPAYRKGLVGEHDFCEWFRDDSVSIGEIRLA